MRYGTLRISLLCLLAVGVAACGPSHSLSGNTNGNDNGTVEPCTPGEVGSCYTGPDQTEGVGICVAGLAVCDEDGVWERCEGEVTPTTEDCDTPTDDDCDGEVNELADGCGCTPGAVSACYTGPVDTEDVGICQGGTMTCNSDGAGYGPCEGEVTPGVETCTTLQDDDCDGLVNEEGQGCLCVPGATEPCYGGPAGTEGVGACVAGVSTCDATGTGYGPCVGEVVPTQEVCATAADDDCDGMANEDGPDCTCTPGQSDPCYNGSAATEGVGTCIGGTQVCNVQGTGYGFCTGEVLPGTEQCDGQDHDCDGTPDNPPDVDGDGWNACQGDCCEDIWGCSDPALVNPGAFEFVGNGVDDDCDPATSDTAAPTLCSTAARFGSVSPTDVAQAMDLCEFTTANPPLAQRKWGVISAEFVRADGSTPTAAELGNMQNYQSAIMTAYGTGGIVPQNGSTMAGISSGRMRDANDPGYVAPNSGVSFGSTGQPPAVYLAAHSGALPASSSCMGSCPAGSGANDSINVRLSIRVPTNAQSFAYNFQFFSSEYWTYACTSFNDFFLALLGTGAAGIPADHNISFDSLGNPVSVNNGFFELCVPHNCYTCPGGSGLLAGTGMDVSSTGGGTVWLQTTAPIVGGEIMVLELMVFDVSDGILDSLSLLDNFEWSINPSGVGTNPD
jgi:putative metal-binding protein